MSEENKRIVRRLVEDVWTRGNLVQLDQLISGDYTHHDSSTPDFGRGPESEKRRVNLYRAAFPDLKLTIEEIIGEADNVMCRWTAQGTHRGPLSGIAPSEKKINISGMTFYRFAAGKVVEGWVTWDALGLLQQIGVVPAPFKAKGVGN